MAQTFKIFISSPGDVNDERRRAALVISRLKREFAHFFDISAVLWEYEPMLSSGHFQDIIDPPSTADIVVVILWSRLGTPLPERTKAREYKGLDGRVPVTGTEWEYEQALNARESRGGVPDLLIYRKFADGQATFSRIEQLEQIRQQWDALQAFWQRHFETPDGQFKAAFNRFNTLDEFEVQFEQHLREMLRRRLPPQPLRLAPKAGDRIEWWSGSPYRGLQAFGVEHAAVFFGRERPEREITEILVRRAEEGTGFILVQGASGSGKSSLVRAGVLPDLRAPGVISGLSTLRYTIVTPTDLVADPFVGLAAALVQPGALPELTAIGYRNSDIAEQLRAGGAVAAVPLRLALQRAAETDPAPNSGGQRQGRLVLVLDQMETLFTSAASTDSSRLALDALLADLARSGLVWVIATLRNDFYHRLAELPALNSLATGLGQYQLANPSPSEIEQIVRRPAEVSGLAFEADERTGIGLDAVIREAAARDPASLPLLSFVLDELYRRDVESGVGNVLTYRSYRELGELEGAIANHAEKLVAVLSPELVAVLPMLLLALVEIDEFKGTTTARTVRYATLTRALLPDMADRLVAARLAVADDSGAGRTLRLAHEALLSRWPRLADLIEADREFLLFRRRLQGDAANWERHSREPDFLLPAGRRVAEAGEILAQRRDDLEPEIIAYAEASITAEKERVAAAQRAREESFRRELSRSRRIAAIVSVLLVLALAGGVFAWQQRNVAKSALNEAEQNYRLALDQAAGSVDLYVDAYDDGAISNKLMQQLVEKAQKTVAGLPGETDDVTAARVNLLDVLSLAQVSLGIVSKAQQFAEEGERLATGLRDKDPGNTRWMRLWATAQRRLSDTLFWSGDSSGAVTHARSAEQVALNLAAQNPDDEDIPRDLMDISHRIGEALRSLGQLDAAAEAQRVWVKRAEAMTARHAENPRWPAMLAYAHQELGDTLEQGGRPAEAAIDYRAAVGLSLALAEKNDSQNPSYLYILGSSRERSGDALLAQGFMTEAMSEYRSALDVAMKLAKIDAWNFQWRELLEAVHERIGEMLLEEQNYDGARVEFRTYFALTKEMIAKAPTNGSALYDVTNAHQKLGDELRLRGDLDGALEEYREGLRLATDLNSRGWWNGAWQKILAMSYQRLGMTLRARGDATGALAHFRSCATIPVNKFAWSPRALWPADVVDYCIKEIAELNPH